jgi:hypothetical protein
MGRSAVVFAQTAGKTAAAIRFASGMMGELKFWGVAGGSTKSLSPLRRWIMR